MGSRRHQPAHLHARAEAHLVQFVQSVSKVNHGRAFYTTPDNLGQYLFVDFLSQKRKWIRT